MSFPENPLRELDPLKRLLIGISEANSGYLGLQPPFLSPLVMVDVIETRVREQTERLVASLEAAGFDAKFLKDNFVVFLEGKQKREFLAGYTKSPVAQRRSEVLKIPRRGETSWLEVMKRALMEASSPGGAESPWAEILGEAGLKVTKDGSAQGSLSLFVEGKKVELKAGINGGNLTLAEVAALGFIPERWLRAVGRGNLDLVLKGPKPDDSFYLQTKGNGDGLIVSHSPIAIPLEEILKAGRTRIIIFD